MTVATLEALPGWQRRAIALAVLAVALIALASLVVLPASAMLLGQQAWRADGAETLERYRALAGSRADLQAELALAESHALWGSFFSAADSATATNALQAEFRGLLDALKIPVQVSAPLDPVIGTRVTQVGVRVEVQLTIDQLQALLERVQANPHRMVLDNVTITAPQYQSPEHNPTLQVQMEVRGFIRRAPDKLAGAGSVVT